MLDKIDIFFIKNLILTKLHNAQDRLERFKLIKDNSHMKEEIKADIAYMSELIKKLEE